MIWHATHRYGATCPITLADAVARSGLSERELAKRTTVYVSGDWLLTKREPKNV